MIICTTLMSSKKVTPKGVKSASAKKAAKKAPAAKRPFPRVTLEEAIKVPIAIRAKNGGNPFPSADVASVVGYGPASDSFFYLTAASRDYGLTVGTRDTAEITLTPLGKRLAYAETPQEEQETRRQAFYNVELFKQVLEYFNGSNLPEMKFLHNTLEGKFSLDPRVHEEFAEIFRRNCEYLNIREGISPVDARDRGKNNGSAPAQSSNDFVTVAEPDREIGVCFVAMPFSEKSDQYKQGFFNEVLNQIIAPAGREAGFKVVTARKSGSDVIHATIVNGLLDADLVIADLTEHNPNVLFELGMRMAEDKPVALIRSKGTAAIFDVDNMLRVEEYDSRLWASTVEVDLPRITEHIKGAWENRKNAQSYMKILRAKAETSPQVLG